jgi:ABC-type Zn uptake system ZnuABC Zn-binding protein ZnuA
MRILFVAMLAVAGLLTLGGCSASTGDFPSDDASTPDDPTLASAIAVASPLITAAVRELVPDRVPLVELAEPGMCPGHFDLRPSQVRRILACRLVLRFDFQKSLDTWRAACASRRRIRASAGRSPSRS